MKLTARLMHQWQFLYKKCNWYDFNFIKLFVEDERMFSNFTFEVWLCGLGFEVIWNYRKNSKAKEMIKKIEAWEDNDWREDGG